MAVDEVAKQSAPWSEGYARMAFRTNINTAITAGRFRQVQDPDIREVVPAFRYDAVGDRDTRDNHRAANGLIMAVDNPAWGQIAPPLGHNCRCSLSLVSVPMLRRMGRIDRAGRVQSDRVPAGAHPDPGFRHGGRPDLMVNEA
jgi:SPP1 gp7 family putative phage head morphogenesis protein